MPALYDFLPAETRTRFPLATLNRRGRALLSHPVPPEAKPEEVGALISALEPRLPKMTTTASAVRRINREHPEPDPNLVSEASRIETYRGLAKSPGRLIAARMMEGALNTISPRREPVSAFPRTIPETGMERAAGMAGSLPVFIPASAAIAATGGAAGLPIAGASALGMGATMAMAPGSPMQRGVRGVVGGALAPVAGAVAGRVGAGVAQAASRMRLPSAAARLIANRGIARFVPYGAAERFIGGATPAQAIAEGQAAGQIARIPAAAATFGIAQPLATTALERAAAPFTGDEAPPWPTAEDLLKSGAEMGVMEAMGAFGHRPKAVDVMSRRATDQAVEGQRGFNTGGGTRFRARWLRSQEPPAAEPTGAPAQPAHEAAAPVEAARPPAPQMPGKTTPWRVERVPGEKPATGDAGAAGVPDEIRDALRKIHATEALSDKYKRDLVPHERRLIDRHYTRIREWATQNEPYRSEVLRADRLRAKAQRESNPNRRAELLRRADAAEYRVQRSIESGSRMVDVQRAKDVAGQNIDLRETRPERQLPAHEGLPREPGRNRRPAPARKQLPDAGLARGEALPSGPEGFYPRALLAEGKKAEPPTEEPPPVAAKPEPPGPKPAPAEVRVSGRSEVGAVESPAKPPPGESAPGTPKQTAGSRGRRSGAPAEAVEPSTAAAPPAGSTPEGRRGYQPKERVSVPNMGRGQKARRAAIVTGYGDPDPKTGEPRVWVQARSGDGRARRDGTVSGASRAGKFTWTPELHRESDVRRIAKRVPGGKPVATGTLGKTLDAMVGGDPETALKVVSQHQARVDELHRQVGEVYPQSGESPSADYRRLRGEFDRANAALVEAKGVLAKTMKWDEAAPLARHANRDAEAHRYSVAIEKAIDRADGGERPPESQRANVDASIGRALGEIAWANNTAARLREQKIGPGRGLAKVAAQLLRSHLEMLAGVKRDFSPAKIAARVSAAADRPAEWAKIRSEIDARLGPEGPADWGGAMSFAGTGEIGRALGHLALRQIPRALENLRRALGRRATTVRLMDGHGNVTDRFDMMEHIFDPYSDFATMRMGAHMRVLGGDTVLPPNLVNHERRASVRREQFVSEWSHRYREEFGDDILQWIGKNKQRANRIAEGLEAPKTPAEKAFKAASKRITDALHAELVAHATRLGLEVPGYRENFVPRFLNGEGETHLRELTAIIDKGLQGKDLEDRLAALTHRRTGDDAYIENYPDNLRRYINYVGRRISHDEFFREVSRYVETDPEVKRGGARGDLVKDWFKSNYLKRRSSFDEAWDDGLRAMAFNRRAKRITENDIPTAAKWLGVSERDLIEKIAKAAPDWVRATTTKGAKNEFAGFTQPKVVIVPKGEKDIRFIAGGQRLPDSVMNRMMERGMTEDQIRAAEGQPITVHLGDWGPGHEAYAVLLGKAVDAAPREFKPQTMAAMRAREAVVRGGRRAGRAIRGIRWDEKLERRLSEESIQETAMRAWENPFEALAHFWTGNIQRAVMGLNLRTAYNNAFNALITSMPEYGLRDFSKAVVRASSATGRAGALKLVRGLIEAQRRRGTIPSASLSGLEAKLAPRLLDEILAHAAGAEQGESYRHQHELKKVAAGRVGLGSRLFDLTDPMVPQQASEGMNRMLDAIGAEIHAARIGLSEGRLAKFRTQILRAGARSRARLMRDLADDIIDPGTRLSYIAAMDDLTQYNYGPRSRMWMMGGGVGRMVSQLSTWPLNNAFKQVLRPAEGALRVAGAAARGVADVTRLVGKPAPPGSRHPSEQLDRRGFIYRSKYPRSKNWVSRWLSAYGANQAHQDAAAHFVRALVLSSFMVGGSIVSGVNFGVAGVNPLFAGVVKLLKAMGLKGDRMKAWLMSHNAPERVQRLSDIDTWDKYATEGSTMSFMRGYGTKLGVLPVSPPTLTILSDLWDEVSANAQAGASEDPAKRAALERKRRIGAAVGGGAGAVVGSMLGARGALAGAATGALVGYAAFNTALGVVRQQLSGWIARTTHLPVGEVAVRRAVAGAPAVRAELERNETARTLTGMRSTMEYENARDWLLDQVGLLSIEKKNAARRKLGGRAAAKRVALPDFPAYPEMPAYPEPAR